MKFWPDRLRWTQDADAAMVFEDAKSARDALRIAGRPGARVVDLADYERLVPEDEVPDPDAEPGEWR